MINDIGMKIISAFWILISGACLATMSHPVIAQETFVRENISYPVIQQSVYFSSIDAARSRFFSYGIKWAPRSLDRTGPTIMVVNGLGQSVERVEGLSFLENKTQLAAMAGYQWALPQTMLGLFAGFEFDARNDIEGRARIESGVRLQGEIWSNPTPQTMLSITMIASSIKPSFWARGAYGFEIREGLYIGPEISTYATDDDYKEGRLGLHITGIKLGPLHFRLSGGGWKDTDQKRGGYGQLTGYIRM
jgi:hypothetical protein